MLKSASLCSLTPASCSNTSAQGHILEADRKSLAYSLKLCNQDTTPKVQHIPKIILTQIWLKSCSCLPHLPTDGLTTMPWAHSALVSSTTTSEPVLQLRYLVCPKKRIKHLNWTPSTQCNIRQLMATVCSEATKVSNQKQNQPLVSAVERRVPNSQVRENQCHICLLGLLSIHMFI